MIAAEAARVLARSAVVVVAVHVQDFLAVDGQQPRHDAPAQRVTPDHALRLDSVKMCGSGRRWLLKESHSFKPVPRMTTSYSPSARAGRLVEEREVSGAD